MTKSRSEPPVSAETARADEVLKDAVAPMRVMAEMHRLCGRYGTERVLQAVREWVAYVDKQIATMNQYDGTGGNDA